MKLFGSKDKAYFDWWSVGHALLYFALTKVWLFQYQLERALLIYVALAYFWEFIERKLENSSYTDHYFKVKECWQNRYIGDVLSGLAGFFLAYFQVF